ncbi:SAM-dependent methyltransferase [Microdochium trichocladiopsis]|uniref:SAM-dependent methyltransferase n=1 Tax=Microdochium trichocladiopsis TaxID=1682393 RepID=A0A9P8YM69_9PEZI|nr:SAM-dependent methyltransferase [Microdochium trichocladiopsis]KAH7041560.1 SAM-dependent methyltransferase [Microdochium trichocladiopsis]
MSTSTTANNNSSADVLSAADAPRLAKYHLHEPQHFQVELVQAEHRIRLINAWNSLSSPAAAVVIKPGARVLELGCGQGTATTVLAEAVGPDGHVDAVDPGSLDYGAPLTLGQAQKHISENSPVGKRISWHQATPEDFLASTKEVEDGGKPQHWDVAVLAHCIWYFADSAVLASVLASLRGRVDKLLIAEHAMHATNPAAVPHVLSIVARGMSESFRAQTESDENVRTPVGPRVIKEVAGGQSGGGWKLVGETSVVPDAGMLDGSWEVGTVMSQYFVDQVEKYVDNARTKEVIMTARDTVISAVKALNGVEPASMDVWVSVFE